jgi:hypothetical protein
LSGESGGESGRHQGIQGADRDSARSIAFLEVVVWPYYPYPPILVVQDKESKRIISEKSHPLSNTPNPIPSPSRSSPRQPA